MSVRVLVLWSEPNNPNLGVRVLAEGTAALVRSVHPDAEVEWQSYGSGSAPVNIGVPRTLARELITDKRGFRSYIKGFDYVVDTRAGDSFADIYGLKRLQQMSAMAEFVKLCGVPVVLGPQTIGPFQTPTGTRIGRWSLRRADLVMARDPQSAEAAEMLGRGVDALTTDVVFALPQPESDGDRDVVLNVSGLLWTSDAHGPASQYQATVREVIAGLQARGRGVTLLSHVLHSDFPDSDEHTVLALGEELGLEAIIPTSLEHARGVLRGANLVIGSRMHACLNALSVGTPAVPLAYSRNFAPLLDALGWGHVVSLAAAQPAAELLAVLDAQTDLAEQALAVRTRAEELFDPARHKLRELA